MLYITKGCYPLFALSDLHEPVILTGQSDQLIHYIRLSLYLLCELWNVHSKIGFNYAVYAVLYCISGIFDAFLGCLIPIKASYRCNCRHFKLIEKLLKSHKIPNIVEGLHKCLIVFQSHDILFKSCHRLCPLCKGYKLVSVLSHHHEHIVSYVFYHVSL